MNTPCSWCARLPGITCDATRCDAAGPGAPGDARECRLCWRAGKRPPGHATPQAPVPRGECRHRGDDTSQRLTCGSCAGRVQLKVFACAVHGRCTVAKAMPGVACCATCADYQPKEPATVKRALTWSYGVTTISSRLDTLLPRTLSSLRAAGFDRPRLFADGVADGAALARASGLEVTCRCADPDPERAVAMHVKGALGAAGNWIAAMHELYQRRPSADRFFLAQDDVAFVRDLRAYLERVPYPARGWLNCHTFPVNEAIRPHDGFVGWYESDVLNSKDPLKPQTGKGALALVFDREAVLALLSHRHLLERAPTPHRGFRNVDGAVVETLNQQGFREWVHWPSLTDHLGEATTIVGGRPHPRPVSFPGEHVSALDFLPVLTRS